MGLRIIVIKRKKVAVLIFTLGIKSDNGLIKSIINTANSLEKNNIDITIIDLI